MILTCSHHAIRILQATFSAITSFEQLYRLGPRWKSRTVRACCVNLSYCLSLSSNPNFKHFTAEAAKIAEMKHYGSHSPLCVFRVSAVKASVLQGKS